MGDHLSQILQRGNKVKGLLKVCQRNPKWFKPSRVIVSSLERELEVKYMKELPEPVVTIMTYKKGVMKPSLNFAMMQSEWEILMKQRDAIIDASTEMAALCDDVDEADLDEETSEHQLCAKKWYIFDEGDVKRESQFWDVSQSGSKAVADKVIQEHPDDYTQDAEVFFFERPISAPTLQMLRSFVITSLFEHLIRLCVDKCEACCNLAMCREEMAITTHSCDSIKDVNKVVDEVQQELKKNGEVDRVLGECKNIIEENFPSKTKFLEDDLDESHITIIEGLKNRLINQRVRLQRVPEELEMVIDRVIRKEEFALHQTEDGSEPSTSAPSKKRKYSMLYKAF